MPVVDLRLVKKEKLDEDEMQHEATMVYMRNFNILNHERQRNSKSVDGILRSGLKDSKDINTDERNSHRRRMSGEKEPYAYRIPIVYPIQSPPLDYQSVAREDNSPTTKDYRLERDNSQSPPEKPRQLYEETNWSTGSPREADSRLEDGSNLTYFTSRLSPSYKNSPYSLSPRSESREDSCISPKNTTSGPNSLADQSAEEKAVTSNRRRNIDRFISGVSSEKEEESLWKQVQRYRHRKRLPVGKLMATQEETIFMQYNEIRERRHREGRITTTRQTRSLSNNNINESSQSPTETGQENEVKTDMDKQPSVSPQLSPTYENNAEHMTPYVTPRPRVVDLAPKSKGVTYVYVTAPSHGSPALSQNSTNPELHPVIYDVNTEHIDGQSNKTKHGFHEYISQDPPYCHTNEPRMINARGRPVIRSGAVDCRSFVPYEDCYHSNRMYHNHRSYRSTPRYHFNDSCHGSRKRCTYGCEHHCCSRKRARPTSSEDDDDDYGVDNDTSRRRKDKHRETRENDDIYRHENGARQTSPASADSRDNESVENGPTTTQTPTSLDNDSHSCTNGHLPKAGSPTRKDSENNAVPHYNTSPIPREDSTRQQDDGVICQVNGLFSLPGYRETKYDITKGELIRRTGLPETLTRVEMISYVRQAKTSGRILLDTHGITTSNRSHPTILSRVCEREAQGLASGIHKMNFEYLPFKNLVQRCVEMFKSRGCDGCQDCRLKLRRRLVDVEIARNTLKELHHVVQEASADGMLESFELASHTFGTTNLLNHLKLIDEYYKQLLIALDKE